jgi:two-component system chemotaxis sensor kinase CheA
MDELLQEFIAETRETLEALAGEIVAWEAAPTDRARLDSIFRFVHTVKGSCGFLDLPRLERLSHAAEDTLAQVRDGTRVPDRQLVNAVLAIVDRIGELVEAIDAGAALDDSSEELLIAALAADAVPQASQTAQPTIHRAPSRSVRLGVDLLDRMMSGMSEMVLARNELARQLRNHSTLPGVEGALERLSLTVADMRDTVTRTRMQKIDALFSALPRMVRDTSAELDKPVVLSVEGSDVELDREMIELMRDPLVHIIRNALDHGIEAADERRAAKKPSAGRLAVSARQSGNQILVEVTDDGRGIDVERLAAKAVKLGIKTAAEAAEMSPLAKLDLAFHPGLSSRDTVTAISGRGVGMDVVRANIEQIGGRIVLTNKLGRGVTVSIQVPLTLSIIPAIIVAAGDQRFALARQSVEEIVTTRGASVRIDSVGDTPIATVRGRRLPVVSLGKLLGLGDEEPRTLAIVNTRDGEYALAIDAVLDTEELVVKPASPIVMATGIYAGKTLPDTGLPMLLLDSAGVAAVAGLTFNNGTIDQFDDVTEANVQEKRWSALLFDDVDGRRRAVPLPAVDRVEAVEASAIQAVGGRLRSVIDGASVAIHTMAALPQKGEINLLRLADGVSVVGYAIAEPVEIVSLPAGFVAAQGGGMIAGVVMVEGEQIELIDVHALFAEIETKTPTKATCLLHGDQSGWMATFLRPALEAAGYHCVSELSPGEQVQVALAMEDADAATLPVAAPVVRLSASPLRRGDGSVYRYDRVSLLGAIADTLAGAA